MGYKEFDLRIPVNISENDLKQYIVKKTGIKQFNYHIVLKSLDARSKNNIVWQYRIGITSEEIAAGEKPLLKSINFPTKKYRQKAIVTGSGPAGIFSALVLSGAGMNVTLIERGSKVHTRKKSIVDFEKSGIFSEKNNYAFGEGGAGTFSDGKLTSRTKSISLERNYIFKTFVDAGAPEEIMYMAHPHVGSDNLLLVTENLRKKLIGQGGTILFDTLLEDILIKENRINSVVTSAGDIEADYVIVAPGHSAYETYRMLIGRGVPFRIKNFAIGMRAEHPQRLINKAQWGVETLPGVKAAEYRLTATQNINKPVYSFCMCPGGVVVPATAYRNGNIVNGMSVYQRNNEWANAAVVAGVSPFEILGEGASPLEALDWLEMLEHSFYSFSNSYKAPAILIDDFLKNKTSNKLPHSSYAFGTVPADFHQLMPSFILESLKTGLHVFSKKIPGYERGILLGLESKTSSPIQAIRDNSKLFSLYDNLFLAGEGSGWAGGIVSSAADGIKVALSVLQQAK